jgi:hypothetical protein
MQSIDNFDDHIEKIKNEIDNLNQTYYNSYLNSYIQTLIEKWHDFEIDQEDNNDEFLQTIDEGFEALDLIKDELTAEDIQANFQDLELIKNIRILFIDLAKEIGIDLNKIGEEPNINVSNIEEQSLDTNYNEDEVKQENNSNILNTEKIEPEVSLEKDPFSIMNEELEKDTTASPEFFSEEKTELTSPKTLHDLDNLSEYQKIREIFNQTTENYNNILEKIKNLNLIVEPEAIAELTQSFTSLKTSLENKYENLNENLKNFIDEMVVDIKQKTEEKITEAIESKKIQTELDKKSKGFLAIGGVSSILFSLFVVIQIFLGITYYQGYVKYQNLMEVFNHMPANQKQQLSEWISNSYQDLNTKEQK